MVNESDQLSILFKMALQIHTTRYTVNLSLLNALSCVYLSRVRDTTWKFK